MGSGPKATRERILAAAADVFATNGYHATGMADIEAAAEVRRGALYYHIGSKEQLLFDLVTRHVDDAYERGRQAIDSSEDAVVQFRELARAHVRTLAERRAEVILSERERTTIGGERGEALRAMRRRYQDLFVEVLERGRSQGSIAEVGSIEVMGLIGLFSYTYVWLDPHASGGIDEAADRLVQLALDGLRIRSAE